jgi:hypothetical protein
MSATCPRGHPSATTDYCDECGTRIESGGPRTAGGTAVGADDEVEVAATEEIIKPTLPPDAERCPRCGAPRTGDDRFCEADGYDFVAPTNESHHDGWEAVVTADRAYYDAVAPDDVEFPDGYEPRTFPLEADAVLVGRRSESRGIVPTIDLAGSPEDNAISHRHAELIRGDDGSYVLVDRGSTNGTSLNTGSDVIPLGTLVPLRDGDRIYLGAWTTITIRRVGS